MSQSPDCPTALQELTEQFVPGPHYLSQPFGVMTSPAAFLKLQEAKQEPPDNDTVKEEVVSEPPENACTSTDEPKIEEKVECKAEDTTAGGLGEITDKFCKIDLGQWSHLNCLRTVINQTCEGDAGTRRWLATLTGQTDIQIRSVHGVPTSILSDTLSRDAAPASESDLDDPEDLVWPGELSPNPLTEVKSESEEELGPEPDLMGKAAPLSPTGSTTAGEDEAVDWGDESSDEQENSVPTQASQSATPPTPKKRLVVDYRGCNHNCVCDSVRLWR